MFDLCMFESIAVFKDAFFNKYKTIFIAIFARLSKQIFASLPNFKAKRKNVENMIDYNGYEMIANNFLNEFSAR